MKHVSKKHFIIATILISLLSTFACDQTEEIVESQDTHVCEHLMDGPSIDLLTVTSLSQAIDSLDADDEYRVQAQLHTRYDLELLEDSTGLFSGMIPYTPVGGSADHILYMNQAVEVSVLNAASNEALIAHEVMDHSDDCDEIAYKGIFELDQDVTYVLSFHQVSTSSVSVLFPLYDGDSDHDH
ncbi:MAG: hypothetical protein U9Q77_04010 [Candidatus Marinimicrobia bacterium]|nr:hypothetical protein [Candidatus Neomarinimicrobiota bacterium]